MRFNITVRPGNKKVFIRQIDVMSFEVGIKHRDARGEANRELVLIMAEHFGLDAEKVRIESGFRGYKKIIVIK